MKKYFYVYILFLIQDINSYITFPLLKDIPSFSKEETPSEIIEKLFDSNLYIKMIIGSENTEVKTYLSNQRHELMIAGNKIKNHKYNENKSLSYKCTYCNEKEFPYGDYNGGIISTENFIKKNFQFETLLNKKKQLDLSQFSKSNSISDMKSPVLKSQRSKHDVIDLKNSNIITIIKEEEEN